MPSRRLSLMLFMAVAIGSGLLICRTIYEKTFQYTTNDEQYSKLPLGPISSIETISKKKLESLERSTENRTPSYRSQIQMQSDSLKSGVGFSNSGPRVEPSRKRFRRHSRKKRNVVKDSNGWFFNLNVTRPGGPVSLSNEEKTDPRFGISIHVEGGKDSDDVEVAWDHVQTLVQNLFGGSYEELSKRGHEVVIDLSGLPSKAQIDLKAKEHLVEIQPPKGKEAKFFLGLLGMGGNRVKATTEKVVSEVSNLFAPSAITSAVIPITEGIPSPTEMPLLEVNPVITDPTISRPITTESTVKPLVEHLETFPVENVDSITFGSSNFSNGLTVVPHVEYVETVSIEGMDSKEESSTSISATEKDENGELLEKLGWTSTVTAEMPKVTQFEVPLENVNLEEISSTENSVLKLSSGTIDLEGNVNESLVTAVPTESFFSVGVSVSPEQLREFCVNILEKVQKSSRSVQELDFEGSENFTAEDRSVEETTETNFTTEASNRPKPENSGFFASILNRIVGRNAAKKPDASSASKRPKSDDHRSSFFTKLVWNSERGRSLEEELENLHLDDDISETEFEDHNVTVSDCETFFKDWLNMDQDVTTPDPLKATTLKVEDVISLEAITEPNEIENQTTRSFDEDERSSNLENAGGNGSSVITVRSISEMTTFEAEDRNLDINETTSDRETTADSIEKDARIFGIFEELAVGSGAREMSIDINDELAEKITTTISGHDLVIKEKNLATEISNDLEVTTEKGRRFINFLNLGSGERELGEESEFTDDYLFTGVSKTVMSTHGTKDTNGNVYNEDFSNSVSTDASMLSQGFNEMPSSTEMAKEYPTTEDDLLHRRFIDFLNLGSGDERELSETNDSGLGIFLPECLSCSVDNRTGKVECSECTQEEIVQRKSEASAITRSDVSTEDEHYQVGSEESDPNERFFLSGNRESTEEIVMKDHDDLTTTTLLPHLAPRGSRALDDPIAAWDNNESEMFDPIVEDEFVVTEEPRLVHKNPGSSKGRRGRSEDSPLEDDPFVAKVVTAPDFVVGVDRISVEIVRNVRPSSKPDELPKFTFNESFVEYFVNESTTEGEDVITTTGGQRLTRSNRCNDDDDCYSDLNEACVAQERQSVCGCEDGFVRSPITRICSKRVVLEMTIRIPNEYYIPDLNDTSSDTYETAKKDFIQTIKILLRHLQLLQDSLVDIEIKCFERGSLIVHTNLVFAKAKEMTSLNIVVSVMEIFKNAIRDPNFLDEAPFKMERSQILKIFVAGDVCDHQGNFKCHKNAKCIPQKNGDFTCKCKRGFVDLNLNGAPGRECEDTDQRVRGMGQKYLTPNLKSELDCSVEFCNGNGICKISHVGTKYCQCDGWNIGPRCAIPGAVVIGGVAAFNALFLVIIVVVICVFRRRKSRSSGQYNGGEEGFAGTPSSAVPSRLRETVAMNELGQSVATSKFTSRSTPRQHKCPDINIISPSNVGSDQSSVFDSTFDRTTCEQEDAEEKV